MKVLLGTATVVAALAIGGSAAAHGTPNGGKCYNGWHKYYGKCHAPHSSQSSQKRYIKNGGKCYNGWFLDTKKNKCVRSRGIIGWMFD